MRQSSAETAETARQSLGKSRGWPLAAAAARLLSPSTIPERLDSLVLDPSASQRGIQRELSLSLSLSPSLCLSLLSNVPEISRAHNKKLNFEYIYSIILIYLY